MTTIVGFEWGSQIRWKSVTFHPCWRGSKRISIFLAPEGIWERSQSISSGFIIILDCNIFGYDITSSIGKGYGGKISGWFCKLVVSYVYFFDDESLADGWKSLSSFLLTFSSSKFAISAFLI
jgi:hypothetical protein